MEKCVGLVVKICHDSIRSCFFVSTFITTVCAESGEELECCDVSALFEIQTREREQAPSGAGHDATRGDRLKCSCLSGLQQCFLQFVSGVHFS